MSTACEIWLCASFSSSCTGENQQSTLLKDGGQKHADKSCDSWEGAASIALAVKTLGLGASVSSVHPRSAGQITTRFVPEKRLA